MRQWGLAARWWLALGSGLFLWACEMVAEQAPDGGSSRVEESRDGGAGKPVDASSGSSDGWSGIGDASSSDAGASNDAAASDSGGRSNDGGASDSGGGSDSGNDAKPSSGCGKTPTLKNSAGNTFSYNSITSGGQNRQYLLRLPANYDNQHAYRLVLGFHGATGNATNLAPTYFGLFDFSNGSTVFLAPDAVGGFWSSDQDVTLVEDILKQVEADLCIDATRVELEGFSQGGAMAFTLACALPNVFRAAVVHSGGGLAMPTNCQPIAYLSSLGQQENNLGQTMTSDFFATADGCTIETLPKAPSGGHLCSDYKGCSAGHPVRWCPYDGGHTSSPNDSGQSTSWMPKEVWSFLSQF